MKVRPVSREILADLEAKLSPLPTPSHAPGLNEDLTAHAYGRAQLLPPEVIHLLLHCAPGATRDLWIRIIYAIHHATGGSEQGFGIAVAFSRGDYHGYLEPKFKGEDDVRKVWKSYDPMREQIVTVGTLIHHAQQGHQQNSAVAINAPSQSPNQRALQILQEQFAIIQLGGSVCLLDIGAIRRQVANAQRITFNPIKLADGRLLAARIVAKEEPNADPGEVVREFMLSPQTLQYRGVTFDPENQDPDQFNLWQEPTLTPATGSWRTLRRFLRDVICAGDGKLFCYLLRYLAHALQKPRDKPGVSLMLVGGQGIGKGTFFQIVRLIWSATTFYTNRVSDVVGDFNGGIEGMLFVLLDEATFAGDRKAWDALKAIITEPILSVNQKHQPVRQIPSYCRVLQATNAEHAGMLEKDDRRVFVLRVSEVRQGDHAYWKALHAAIENGEVAALMYALSKINLSGFNVRDRPMTTELVNQKIHSLPLLHKWWLDRLTRGYIDPSVPDKWPTFISTHVLVLEAQSYLSGLSRHTPCDSRAIWDLLRKVCPDARKDQQPSAGSSPTGRERGAVLPDLATCRRNFEAYVRGSIAWD